jgi:hypothetical protein
MALYEIAVLGRPTGDQIAALTAQFVRAAADFKLTIGDTIALSIDPTDFVPNVRTCAAAVFFGYSGGCALSLNGVVDPVSVPVVPIASTAKAVSNEIPVELRSLNCLFADTAPPERIFSAILACLGLLPRQRRVFLSYRRDEATAAAVQLFAELCARQFDVFLDTHVIEAGVLFQEALWHELCTSDVLMMLETPNYFESRWTNAEYGRALAKGIGVVRIQWPDATPSVKTATASRVELLAEELGANGMLADSAIQRICIQLEAVRCLSHATRQLSMISAVQSAIERVEGAFHGIGLNRAIHVSLRSGKQLHVQPVIGVPTAHTLQYAMEQSGGNGCAVVYDHFGIRPDWLSHLTWLAEQIDGAKWIRQTDCSWEFGGWEAA